MSLCYAHIMFSSQPRPSWYLSTYTKTCILTKLYVRTKAVLKMLKCEMSNICICRKDVFLFAIKFVYLEHTITAVSCFFQILVCEKHILSMILLLQILFANFVVQIIGLILSNACELYFLDIIFDKWQTRSISMWQNLCKCMEL